MADSINRSNSNNELVAIAKTWIQRDEQFPIEFDEIWERAGYQHRKHAARAFKLAMRNFNLVEGLDFTPLKGESTGGRPSQSWKMTIGAAKRFLASAQTEEGYAIIDALVKAEEELQSIKADTHSLVASIVDDRLNAMIPVMIERVTSGVLLSVLPQLNRSQPQGLSMRELVAKSRTLVLWHDSVQQDYGYTPVQASRSFGKIIKNAAKHAGATLGTQNGIELYDSSKLLAIVENAARPMAQFSKRNRNRYKPAKDQLDFDFLNRN